MLVENNRKINNKEFSKMFLGNNLKRRKEKRRKRVGKRRRTASPFHPNSLL